MKNWGKLLPFLIGLMLIVGYLAETAVSQPTDTQLEWLVYLPHIQNKIGNTPPPPPIPTTAAGPLYGVNFISSAEQLADEQQYQNGLSTGATWNRWPLYWFNIEQTPGQFNWSAQDATAIADIAHGFNINAILLGTPGFYTTNLAQAQADRPSSKHGFTIQATQAATPAGLYEPIFNDGTDIPGPGKQINPSNVWAVYVWTAVNRYKPNGILAQQQGWPTGTGITHWEMWNEPDLPFFWDSSLADYARLLKVGYLTTKHADPNAQVLFGAMANNSQHLTYYHEVLNIYDSDPLADSHDYYHDIFVTHSYFYAWNSWYHVWRSTNTMSAHGLVQKPIWLNESGVPAWDDYPGPVWDPASPLRATMSEQADYVIQNAFYARYAGADAIFHFQLYDGCGNQPAGTDFPPHNGDMCDENGNLPGTNFPCAGDANGLFRNPTDAACFSQHPQPESARPNLAAFQILTTYLTDVAPFWRQRPGGQDPYNGPQEWIALYQPSTHKRIVGMWARFGQHEVAVIEATSPDGTAMLVFPDGTTQLITAVNNHYTIQLPAATNQNAFWDPTLYPIGGRPVILIETQEE